MNIDVWTTHAGKKTAERLFDFTVGLPLPPMAAQKPKNCGNEVHRIL
jgi:hypothetical protein